MPKATSKKLDIPSLDGGVQTKSKKKSTHYWAAIDPRVFTLEVRLVDGPMTDEFLKANRRITRTIQMRGDQSLDELHAAIYDAFGRDDPHLYEFQIGGNVPHARSYQGYVSPEVIIMNEEDSHCDFNQKDASITNIGTLDLKPKRVFFYWFDFGDDWWHKISVKSIEEEVADTQGAYPKIIKSVGENPPQYPDWDT